MLKKKSSNKIMSIYPRTLEDSFRLPDIYSPAVERKVNTTVGRRRTRSKKSSTKTSRRRRSEYEFEDDGNIVIKPNVFDSSSDSDEEEEDSKYYYNDEEEMKFARDRTNLVSNLKREWDMEYERIPFNQEFYKMKTPQLLKFLKRIRLSQNFQENSMKLLDSTIEELFDMVFQGFAQGSRDDSMITKDLSSKGKTEFLEGKKGRLFEISEFGFLVKSKKKAMIYKFKKSFRDSLMKFHKNFNVFKKFERGNLRRQQKRKLREMENRMCGKSMRESCDEEMSFIQLFYQIKQDLSKEREVVAVLEKKLESSMFEKRNQDFEILCVREQLRKRDTMIDTLKKRCYKELMKMKKHFVRNRYEESKKLKKRMNAYKELLKNPLPFTLSETKEDEKNSKISSGTNATSVRRKRKRKKKRKDQNLTETQKNKNASLEFFIEAEKKRNKNSKVSNFNKVKKSFEEEEDERDESSESEYYSGEEEGEEGEVNKNMTELNAPIYFFQPLSIFSWGNVIKLEVSKLLKKQANSYDLLIHQMKKNFQKMVWKEFRKYLELVNRMNEMIIFNSKRNVTVSRDRSKKDITDQFQELASVISTLEHKHMEKEKDLNRMKEAEFKKAKEAIQFMIQTEHLKKKNEFLKDQLRKKMIGIQELCDRLEEFKLITRNERDKYMYHDTFSQETGEDTKNQQSRNVNFLLSKKKAFERIHDENKKFMRLLARVKEIKQFEMDTIKFSPNNALSTEQQRKVEFKWDFIKKTLYNYVLVT